MKDSTVPSGTKSTTADVVHHTSATPQSIDAHEELGYYPIAFISCCLPYRDPRKRSDLIPAEAFSWTRHNGPVSLSLTAGSYIDGKGETQLHLPFGRYARVLLMWLTTSALKHQSRSFPLPTSARGLLAELNIDWSRSQARDIITQLRALLATQCVVTHHEKRSDNFVDISEERFTIGTRARLHFSTDENYGDFDPSSHSHIELSEQFYSYLVKGNFAPVLLARWRRLIEENTSPLAADLFLWLAFRAPQISKDTHISWANLQSQVGSFVTPGRERDFAATVTRALGKVSEIYPEMRFTISGTGNRKGFRGLVLHPSPDADLLGLNPQLQYEAIAKVQSAAEQAGLVETSQAYCGVNLQQLRGELLHNGLTAAEHIADKALEAVIDVVIGRAKTPPVYPQAYVRSSIINDPSLLPGAPTPTVATGAHNLANMPAAPAVAAPGTVQPYLCPVHQQMVEEKVCRDCAVELKMADTDHTTASDCWQAIDSRLDALHHAGVKTAAERVSFTHFAIIHGVN
ncbi:replication protein RepA [Rothia mucilaginosa]|nr:replication protein RepA [Rothia mucilaginosa]